MNVGDRFAVPFPAPPPWPQLPPELMPLDPSMSHFHGGHVAVVDDVRVRDDGIPRYVSLRCSCGRYSWGVPVKGPT